MFLFGASLLCLLKIFWLFFLFAILHKVLIIYYKSRFTIFTKELLLFVCVNVRWVSIFGVLGSNKVLLSAKKITAVEKHPQWLVFQSEVRKWLVTWLHQLHMKLPWNQPQRFRWLTKDRKQSQSVEHASHWHTAVTSGRYGFYDSCMCLSGSQQVWNMNKRKLSKSYFTLWYCCVILGYLGSLSLSLKPDILVKYDIISKSLRDETTAWTNISNIYATLCICSTTFHWGGYCTLTSLHLLDSFNYFRKLAAYKTQYMFNN